MTVNQIEKTILEKYNRWKSLEVREPYFAVAVDFDNTLFKDNFPGVGETIKEVIELCHRLKQIGDMRLILWTCRGGAELVTALEAGKSCGLLFDAVNEDLPEIRRFWESQEYKGSKKISAKYYIDDLGLNPTM